MVLVEREQPKVDCSGKKIDGKFEDFETHFRIK
jgi:hypothetical protein